MPRRIEVNRAGPLAWITVDGHEMWAEDVTVQVDPNTRPSVRLTLTASEVIVANRAGVSYGETQREEATAATG